MKIFVSYASEHRSLAEAIAAELRPLGHRVFLDRHALAPGENYTDQIRKSIEQSELFIFLISPEAVTPGRYTMSELSVMQEAAPSASGRVLPVMARTTPLDSVPDYLRSVTILTPTGDLVTETVNAVATGESRAKRRRYMQIAAASFTTACVVALIAAFALAPQVHQTVIAPANPFSVYGSNFVGQGQTAVVNVTNQRPDLYKDVKCKLDTSQMKANIESVEHDTACENITIKTKWRPFVNPDETLISPSSYDRTPLPVEIMWAHGQVIWRGEWQIGFKNFVDPKRISLRKVDSSGNPLDVALNTGRVGDFWFEVLFDGKPLADGYGCKKIDKELVFKGGGCVFQVTGYYASDTGFAATLLLVHPKTGWVQDHTFDTRQ